MTNFLAAIQQYSFLLWLVKLLASASAVAAAVAAIYWLIGRMSDDAKKFWLGVFSDSGLPSASRVMSLGMILPASIIWVSYLVVVNHALPDLRGVAMLIGTPYGLNVGTKAVSGIFSKPGEAQKAGS